MNTKILLSVAAIAAISLSLDGASLPLSINGNTAERFVVLGGYARDSQLYIQVELESIPGEVGTLGWVTTELELEIPSALVLFTFDDPLPTDQVISFESFDLNSFLGQRPSNWIYSHDFKDQIEVTHYPWVWTGNCWLYLYEPTAMIPTETVAWYSRWMFSQEIGWSSSLCWYPPVPGLGAVLYK